MVHSDPRTLDQHHHDSCALGPRQFSDPHACDHRHRGSYNHDHSRLQPHMDDMAWLFPERNLSLSDDGHIAGCPSSRRTTGRDLCRPGDFDPVDSLIRNCPSCWRDHGRDYIPTLYGRPSYEHLELPALICKAQDVETARRIVNSNLKACLRNREVSRDMDSLLYPIRNRFGEYPSGFEEPRPISWLMALDRECNPSSPCQRMTFC